MPRIRFIVGKDHIEVAGAILDTGDFSATPLGVVPARREYGLDDSVPLELTRLHGAHGEVTVKHDDDVEVFTNATVTVDAEDQVVTVSGWPISQPEKPRRRG